MKPCGDKPGDVRHIDHEDSSYLVGYFTEACKIYHTRVRARTRDDHLGVTFKSRLAHRVIVDGLGDRIDAVMDYIEILTRNIQLHTVRKMTACGKAHRKHRISRLQQRKEHGKVCGRAAVRLNVGMLGAEKPAGTLARQFLYLVNISATAVITASGIALGIFVCKHSARGEEHCLGHDILGCDKLDIAALAGKLARTCFTDLGIECGKFFKKHKVYLLSWGQERSAA